MTTPNTGAASGAVSGVEGVSSLDQGVFVTTGAAGGVSSPQLVGSVTTVDTYASTPSPSSSLSTPSPGRGVVPRAGSRADRMAMPRLVEVARGLADQYGACVRPLYIRKVERATGRTVGGFEMNCRATLASKCKACAARWRALQQRQIAEGWHLTEEPVVPVEKPTAEVVALVQLRCEIAFERDLAEKATDLDRMAELDQAADEVDELLATQRCRGSLLKSGVGRRPRRVRSTKRRVTSVALPRRRVENRSLGKVYTDPKTGRQHRPSTWLTTTLGSFGAVHTGERMRRGQLMACGCGSLHGQNDPILGTPLNPDTYDYRGHALALIFFSAVMDRFWQNLRRAVGFMVAYAGCVEMQKRQATHGHYAVRGSFSRALVKQVAAGTDHGVWWPQFERMVYPINHPPVWDAEQGAYVDPKTRVALPAWDDVVDSLDHDAPPAHIAHLGSVDVQGVGDQSKDRKQTIRYMTKYVTKDLVDPTRIKGPEQLDHLQRLYDELEVLPCSPGCANWLLYGVQPQPGRGGVLKPDLVAGACRGKVHQLATLGFTGRRCPKSRNWSTKTLADHRQDSHDAFLALIGEHLGPEAEPTSEFYWVLASPHDRDVPSYVERIMHAIARRTRTQRAIQAARDRERQRQRDQSSGVPAIATAA